MDYGIFNVHTDVNACDCTRGCRDTATESALKVDSRRKIPCRTGESNLRQRRAGQMLYQLSYLPTPSPFLLFGKSFVGLLVCQLFHSSDVSNAKPSPIRRESL